MAILARAKNLALGCRVTSVRAVRSIRKGAQGLLMALGKEALVKWDEGALVDVAGHGEYSRHIPLASLQAAAETRPETTKKEDSPKEEPLPAGEPWAKLTDELGVHGMMPVVLVALYQVYANRSAGPSTVMIEQGGQERAIRLSQIKPRGLLVLPLVQELHAFEGKVLAGARRPLLWVKAGAADLRFEVLAPAAPTCPEVDSSMDEGDAGGSPRFVDLFGRYTGQGQGRPCVKPRRAD